MKLGRRKQKPPVGRQRQSTTDWQRPAAFSYHANRVERTEGESRQSASLVDKRRQLLSLQFWVRRSGFLLVIIVALVCIISILSLSSTPRIVFLDMANSNTLHDVVTYQQGGNSYLASSIWNRNKITIDTGAASRDLQRRYPELASVSITLPLVGHRPIYYLRANQPAFVMQAVNGQFVLDSNGTALLTKASLRNNNVDSLPLIADQSGSHVEIGKQVLSAQEARFVSIVDQSLAAAHYDGVSYALPANAAQELDARLSGQPYSVKFNMHDATTARQQVGTFLATINQLTGQHVTPAQYVDVRVIGRAYYQ